METSLNLGLVKFNALFFSLTYQGQTDVKTKVSVKNWCSVWVTYIPYRTLMHKKLVSKKWRNIDDSFLRLLWNADRRPKSTKVFERERSGEGFFSGVWRGNYGVSWVFC